MSARLPKRVHTAQSGGKWYAFSPNDANGFNVYYVPLDRAEEPVLLFVAPSMKRAKYALARRLKAKVFMRS